MAADNRLFDDLARMAGGAVSLLSAASKQIKSDVSTHLGDVAGRMDLAERKDLDRLIAMVTQLRVEQEDLKARLDALEGKKSEVKKPAAKIVKLKTAAKKTATQKTPAKKIAPKTKKKK